MFCGQEWEDESIGEKFICGQMWKNNSRKSCSKCSGTEKTKKKPPKEDQLGNLEVLKEKCVECGKTPATLTRDSVKWYCEDCGAKLLFGGKKVGK